MYNTKLQLTYHNLEGDVGDTQYRKELLDVFSLKEFNLEEMNILIKQIYDILPKNKEFNCILKKNANDVNSDDLLLGFMLCFTYNKFYLIHQYICDYLDNKIINSALLKMLNDL